MQHGGPTFGPSARDRFWIVLLLVFPILVFPNLGNAYLWQDEGETAVLARCVQIHGYPLASYRSQTVSDQDDHRDLKNGVWIWTPWLPIYVVATSFAVFGESTWAARLPLVLAAWATVLLSYPFFLELTRSRRLSRLGSVVFLTSVPFLLHARQCRYYSLLVLFALTHTWGYVRILRGGRWGRTLVAASGGCLAQTFLPQLVASTVAIGVHALWIARDRSAFRKFLGASAVAAVVSLPFFLYSASWSRDYFDTGHGFDSVGRFTASVRSYVLMLHAYAWPFLLAIPLAWRRAGTLVGSRVLAARLGLTALAVAVLFALSGPPGLPTFAVTGAVAAVLASLVVAWFVRISSEGAMAADWRPMATLLIAGTTLAAAALCPYPYFRYLLGILPLASLSTAHLAGELVRWNRWGIAVVGALLIGTNLLSQGPIVLAARAVMPEPSQRRDWIDRHMQYGYVLSNVPGANVSRIVPMVQPWSVSPFADYLDEITHDHDGPVEGVVRYLRANAKPGQVLMTTYENFPLMFYTDLTVLNLAQAERSSDPPDWIFIHKMSGSEIPQQLVSAILRSYEPVAIAVKEVNFENIPEPYWHYYRTRTDGHDITFFRRKPTAF